MMKLTKTAIMKCPNEGKRKSIRLTFKFMAALSPLFPNKSIYATESKVLACLLSTANRAVCLQRMSRGQRLLQVEHTQAAGHLVTDFVRCNAVLILLLSFRTKSGIE